MIEPISYSKEWIDSLKKANKGIDPSLCEKMIRALGLSEALVLNDLDFVFKGGTSLILLIQKPERFSIDIDINTETSKEKIEEIIKNIMGKGLFKHYIEKKRQFKGIPKAHYYFYYDSMINGKETYLMLDVLFGSHSYPKIIDTPIQSHWIKTRGNAVTVKTPDINSLIGDKLTVFAPNTTGIKYETGKSMEIIKQLFDIGRLFDHISDLQTVKMAFRKIATKELAYRELILTPEDVLDDIIKTSLIVSKFPGGGKHDTPELKELLEGLKRFKSYPIAIKYRADDAILTASKAAYLATILKTDESKVNYYSIGQEPESPNLPVKYQNISKLRRRLPEAYYYWYKAIESINPSPSFIINHLSY